MYCVVSGDSYRVIQKQQGITPHHLASPVQIVKEHVDGNCSCKPRRGASIIYSTVCASFVQCPCGGVVKLLSFSCEKL